MSIKDTLKIIEHRLDSLQSIPGGDQTEFVRGSIVQLEWCLGKIKDSIDALLPDPKDFLGEELYLDDDEEEVDSSLSLIRPPRYAISPCVSHREHAYIFHAPERNQKQCKYCGDTQPMRHGEKISFGKRTRKS